MCGLVAVMSYTGQSIDRAELLDIRDAMASRGPDGAGFWISENRRVGLGHRRLALVDLSDAGGQPMVSRDGLLRIVFNGEIYNYRELREYLEKRGCVFRSSSDTEVLLNLYAEIGEEMVERLRGMYAFVIWDEKRQHLFAARDPFGIKPLYYAEDSRQIRFASQVKALLKSRGINTTREPAGQVGFLLWGYVPEPFTLYKSIVAFPAGTSLTIKSNGHRSLRQFCSISEELSRLEGKEPSADSDPIAVVRDSIADSVGAHLLADVPVAVFLSAGLDSAVIAGLATEEPTGKIISITLGFEEFRDTENDETAQAEVLAKHFRTDHHVQWYSRNDFETDLEKIMNAMDQPSIDGINTYLVSKAAHSYGIKAALSGVGGDELFGSYPSFRDVPRMTRLLCGRSLTSFGSAFRTLSSPLFDYLAAPKYAGLIQFGGTYAGAYILRRGLFMPWDMSRVIPAEIVSEGWARLAPLDRLEETIGNIESPRMKVSALEISWYMRNQLLRDSDWAGMANSIEIRTPMVDLDVLRSIGPVVHALPKNGKQFLKNIPRNMIPESVAKRRKTGFAVPIHDWLSGAASVGLSRNLSSGLRNWATRLVKEFDLIG